MIDAHIELIEGLLLFIATKLGTSEEIKQHLKMYHEIMEEKEGDA